MKIFSIGLFALSGYTACVGQPAFDNAKGKLQSVEIKDVPFGESSTFRFESQLSGSSLSISVRDKNEKDYLDYSRFYQFFPGKNLEDQLRKYLSLLGWSLVWECGDYELKHQVALDYQLAGALDKLFSGSNTESDLQVQIFNGNKVVRVYEK